jgi:poly(A) polymerase
MWTRTVNLFPADSNSKQPLSLAFQALLERPAVSRLLSALNSNNEQARIVGGAVRDAIMGRAASHVEAGSVEAGDVDIATTALPETVIQLAKSKGWKAIPTGIEHGTVTLVVEGIPYEVTTLRRDVETDGRRAVVAFSRDFKEDAFRRDFTINALSLSLDGTIHDYATGISDAKKGIIRFMGDPETRIREDYLRILRFFRFQATHGRHNGEIDQSSADFQACGMHKAGLSKLSRERIRRETLKLMDAPGCLAAVRAMESIDIWEVLLPGIDMHMVALEHLIALEKATCVNGNTMLRLAAFCGPSFHASKLQKMLVLSNLEYKRVLVAEKLAHEMTTTPLAENTLKKIAFKGGHVGCTDALLLTHSRNGINPQATAHELMRFKQTFLNLPSNPFTSEDVVALGIEPGPRMGRILKQSLELWLHAGLPEDAITQARILDTAMKSTDLDVIH